MKKVYVIGADNYANWLAYELADRIEEADLVLFTGGTDVSPELYGDVRHRFTGKDLIRDMQDIYYYNYAVNNSIPMLGICRGSQFLTAMQPKGKLIQDVTHHAMGGTHEIMDARGNLLEITSTHHQMHYPFDMDQDDYEIIAWSDVNRSHHYQGGKGNMKLPDNFVESEIIYFTHSNALGIQGHPEHLNYEHPTCEYLRELVEEQLF